MATRVARIKKVDKSTNPFTEEFVSPLLELNFALNTAAKWNLLTAHECIHKGYKQFITYEVVEDTAKFGTEEITKP